jgi:hypothetical protein
MGQGIEANYQPRVCIMDAVSNADTANPFMAPVHSSLASASTFGSS